MSFTHHIYTGTTYQVDVIKRKNNDEVSGIVHCAWVNGCQGLGITENPPGCNEEATWINNTGSTVRRACVKYTRNYCQSNNGKNQSGRAYCQDKDGWQPVGDWQEVGNNCSIKYTDTNVTVSCLVTPTPTPTTPVPTDTPTPTPISPNLPEIAAIADVNRDGRVNTVEYFVLLKNYNSTGSDLGGDTNKDGVVNALDLSIFILYLEGRKSSRWV